MKFGESTWPEVEALDKNKIVILPLGSFEQHGRHLPLLTDTLIITAIAEQVEEAQKETVLLLPTLWLGYSPHHLGFPGTLTVEYDTYVDILCQILNPLIELGFRKILALNGHAGNECTIRIAMREVRRKLKGADNLWLVIMSEWTAARKMLHACEIETSLVLSLRADLVRMEEAKAEVKEFHSDFYSFDFDKPDIVTLDYAFREVTKTGAIGHPELATEQEGKKLLQKIVSETIRFVNEFALW